MKEANEIVGKLIELAAEMARGERLPSEFIEDYELPKSTPKGAMVEIEKTATRTRTQVCEWGLRIKAISRQIKNMGKVIPLGNVTRLDLPPDRILEGAKGQLEGVVVMGWNKNGNQYFASSYASGAEVLWLIETCKKALMEVKTDGSSD